MDFSKYENELPYPSKKQLNAEIRLLVEELKYRSLTRSQYDDEVEKIEDMCKDSYQKNLDYCHKQDAALRDQFWKDAREELDYGHLSKSQIQMIEDKAWEEGHANGYSEVYNCLSDIIDFLDGFYSK